MNQTLLNCRRSPLLALLRLVRLILARLPLNLPAAILKAMAGGPTRQVRQRTPARWVTHVARTRVLVLAVASLCSVLLANGADAQSVPSSSSDSPAVADGAVAPGENSSSAYAGALASTDPNTGTGRASYSFRLEVARGKAQPSLGVDYSSVSGQREAGVGWGLSLPAIERKNASGPPNYANDPSPTQPLSACTDRFVFSGSQLVPICQITAGGTCTGAPSGETMPAWAGPGWSYFRAEVDRTFQRFFWSADHYTWVVESRSGTIEEFGQPLDSVGDTSACDMDQSMVIPASGVTTSPQGVFRWNLVRMHDTMGGANEVQYLWRNVNGAQRTYLTDILDTSVSAAYSSGATKLNLTVAPFAHHTHLTWVPDEPLPQPMQPRMFRAAPDQLLTQVDVTSATFEGTTPRALVRSYALTYVPRGTLSLGWWRSVLSSIQMTGACPGVAEQATGVVAAWGAGTCPTMPATQFTYASNVAAFAGTTSPPNSVWQTRGSIGQDSVFIDLDGDGAVDAVHAPNWDPGGGGAPSYPQYYRNFGLGSLFGVAQSMGVSDASIGGGDMDQEIFAGVSIGAGFQDQPFYVLAGNLGLNSMPGADIFTMNVNTQQYMTFSTAMTPSSTPQVTLYPSSATWTNATSAMTRSRTLYQPIVAQVDVDGDGFVDWTGLDSSSGGLVTYTSFSTLTPEGSLLIARQPIPDQPFDFPVQGADAGSVSSFYMDANGDGVVDSVATGCFGSSCTIAALLGKGDGTYNGGITWQVPLDLSAEAAAGTAAFYLHDVNGDGFADLVVSDNAGVEIMLTQGIQANGTVIFANDPLTGTRISIPPPPDATNWVGGDTIRFADVDASGVDDIVILVSEPNEPAFYNAAKVYYVDLLGGGSTPLLQTIDNGRGSTTTFAYQTTANLSAAASTSTPWSSQTPQNVGSSSDPGAVDQAA